MAKYKGREYRVVEFPSEEYTVIIADKDGEETVKLRDVTLTREEAAEFFKLERMKLTNKEKENVDLIERDKALEKANEPPKPASGRAPVPMAAAIPPRSVVTRK